MKEDMAWIILVVILFVLIALYFFCIRPGKVNPVQTEPFLYRFYAHRGLYTKQQDVPENSLPAFQRAVESDYGVELDVQFTKDGKLVVFHDDMLDRATNLKGRVDAYTYDELLESARLFGTDEKIPLFTEVLDILDGHVPVIVELKSCADFDKLSLETARTLDCCRGPFCVESFDPRIVRWFYRNRKEWVRGQLAEPYSYAKHSGKPVRAFLCSCLFFNHFSHPQFIAYRISKKPFSVRLCELLGAMRVAWTMHESDPMDKMVQDFDCIIFEWMDAPHSYREISEE